MSLIVDRICHQFSIARPARRVSLVLLILAALMVVGASAWAFWTTFGSGTGSAATGTLNPPTNVTVPGTNNTGSVHVTWTPSTPANGLLPQGYYVTKTTGAITSAACGSSAAVLLVGGSSVSACDDIGVSAGTYTYRVVAVFHSWTAQTAASGSVLVQLASKVVFTTQPSNTVGAGVITPPVTATVQDASSAAVPVAGTSVTIGIGANPSTGTLSGTLTATTNASGVATFSNLSIDNSGNSYTLSASSSGLTSATSSAFNITKRSQTIGFTSTAPGSATVSGSTYTVAASASSGLTVVFTSATTPVCTVSGSTVSFIGVGTCTVNANQAGNANYNAAPQVQQSFTVSKANQTITFTSSAPGSATFGGSYTVAASASSGLTVTFTSATTPVCTVSGSTVSFAGVGTCTVNANQAGNANYNAASQVQQTFAVGKGSQTISFSSTAPGGATVGGATYAVTATTSSGLTVALTSATTGVCTLAGSTVSFIAAGTCTINANQAGDANYNAAAQVPQTFTVAKGAQTISVTSTAPGSAAVGGSTYTVAATASSGLAVAFSSASPTICTVAGSTVSFIAAGTCTISANQVGDANYNAAPQVAQTFAVAKANQTITFTSAAPSSAFVGGSSYTVAATATSGLSVAFTSATTPICTVSGSTVSFIATGTCTINANQAGDANYNAAPQVQQSFTVSAAPLTITTVIRSGGNKKVLFNGTGAVATTTITVTICAVNSFPCAAPIATSLAVTPAAGSWASGTSNNNLNASQTYFAQAVQGSTASAIFTFSTSGL